MVEAQASRQFDIAAFIETRKLSRFNFMLIGLSWLITVFDGFDMMLISFTAPYMRDELSLTEVELGNVFSAGLVGMMLGGFVFAYLGDRIGRRRTIVSAAFIFGLLTMATAMAQSYEVLLLLRLLDGAAIGGMLPLAWALNIEYVSKRFRATVITIIMMGYSLGAALAGPVTVWLAPQYGWEGVFVFGGAVTLVIALAMLALLPESIRFLVARGVKKASVVAILKRMDPRVSASQSDQFYLGDEAAAEGNFKVSMLFAGDFRRITPLLWLGYIASTLAVYFMANWSPIVYEDLAYSRDTAAYVSSISSVLGAGLGLMLMRITDTRGAIAVAVYPALAFPALLLIGTVDMGQSLFLVLSALASALVSGAHFGILSIAGIYYATSIRANGAGWATSIAKIGGIAGPIIGGHVLASGLPIVRSFAILSICPLVLGLCAWGIARAVSARTRVPDPSRILSPNLPAL